MNPFKVKTSSKFIAASFHGKKMPSGSSCTADVTDTFSYDWIQFRTVGPGVFVNYRELSNTSTLQVKSFLDSSIPVYNQFLCDTSE